MVESVTSTSPGAAPSTLGRARRRRARAGRSSRASRATSSRAPLVDHARSALARGDRQPAERVAVEVDAVARRRCTKRSRKRRQRVGGVERLGVARGSRAIRSPPSRAGWPGRGGRSGPRRARRARPRRRRPRGARRSAALISTGTMSSSPPCVSSAGRRADSARSATRARSDRVLRARRRSGRDDAVGEPQLPRRAQVQHARLGDRTPVTRATRRASGSRGRAAAQAARCPPAEWPIATTRARSTARADLGQVVDRGGHVVERLRQAAAVARAAGTRCSTPPSRARRGPRTAGPSACGRTRPSRTRRGSEHRDRPLAVYSSPNCEGSSP